MTSEASHEKLCSFHFAPWTSWMGRMLPWCIQLPRRLPCLEEAQTSLGRRLRERRKPSQTPDVPAIPAKEVMHIATDAPPLWSHQVSPAPVTSYSDWRKSESQLLSWALSSHRTIKDIAELLFQATDLWGGSVKQQQQDAWRITILIA